ncbi:MAG: cell wall hydrolase [Proteobacteria bacterium]|nr:cell wall hydrolase [Pseudomonadota bacterium]
MDAPRYRNSRQRFASDEDDYLAPLEPPRSAFREYAPVVFGGIMLVVAFAFAGHQIGRNASAHTSASLAASSFQLPELPQTSSLTSKGSLLPDGESMAAVNSNTNLRRMTVLSDGKGDLLIYDPGVSQQLFAGTVIGKSKGSSFAKTTSEKDTRIKIQPASFSADDQKLEDAAKIAKKLALAPKPANIDKSLKLDKQQKQAALKQRRFLAAEENCLARAVYFEARSETEMGQIAVAKVIMNRVKDPNYPKTVCGVVYQGSQRRNSCQFSFACDGLPDDVKNPAAWSRSKKIAQKVMSGDYKMVDAMSKATNYHADYVKPRWARSMKKIVKIGTHIFYDENG